MQVVQKRHPAPEPPEPGQLNEYDTPEQEVVAARHQSTMQKYETAVTEAAKPIAEMMLFAEIKRWGSGRYGVVISESPATPTQQMANSIELERIDATYPGVVPPDVYINASGLPKNMKEEIVSKLQQQQQTPSAA